MMNREQEAEDAFRRLTGEKQCLHCTRWFSDKPTVIFCSLECAFKYARNGAPDLPAYFGVDDQEPTS